MAEDTVATPEPSRDIRTAGYVALVLHMASLYDHEPTNEESEEHRTWQEELQQVWNESLPALFKSFPNPSEVRLKRRDLEHLMLLALDLVQGGIQYRDMGSPRIAA